MEKLCNSEKEHLQKATEAQAFLEAQDVRALGRIFHLLSDEGRLKIVLTLMQGDMCVYHLTEACGGSQSGVSHQLRALRDGKIVKAKRVGKAVEYSLADEHVREIVSLALAHAVCKEHG